MPTRKIEYVFGPPRPKTGHSLGISALSLTEEMILGPQSHATLVSGGRDGRLNLWALGGPKTVAVKTNDAHTNWVTDILVKNADSVISSSVDTTVKHWNPRTDDINTIGHHTDYAQCLSDFSSSTIVSGGLDGALKGWDLNTNQLAFQISTPSSIYSVTTVREESPHTVVSGTYDGTVSVWDVRQPQNAAATIFRGHDDTVRCLYSLNNDLIVSGSSDATVKIWSQRTGRTLRSFSAFKASVWSLCPTPDYRGFWAGDRTGSLYLARDFNAEPEVIASDIYSKGSLEGLCLDPATNSVWVSSPLSPDIKCVSMQPTPKNEPLAVLKGHSGLRKHRLLNDKRRALVVDTEGKIGMVDLVSAKTLDFERRVDLSKVDVDEELDKVLEEVNTMDVLDNWCQVQIKAGEISVALDYRSINNAEVYLDDLFAHVNEVEKTPLPTPQQSPMHSPVASPMSTPHNSGFFRQSKSPFVSPAVSRVTSTQSLNELSRIAQSGGLRKLGTGKGHAMFYDPEDDDNEDGADNTKPQTQSQPAPSSKAHLSIPGMPAPLTPAKIKINDDETEEPADAKTVDDEIRINLGNFVLENLLRGVVDRLKKEYESLPPSSSTASQTSKSTTLTRSSTASQHVANLNDHHSNHNARPERKRTRLLNKLFGRKKDDETSSLHSHAPSTTSAASTAQTETSAQQAKQKQQQQHQALADSNSFMEAWSRAKLRRTLQSADPESPTPDVLSRKARLVVSEIAPGAGAPTEIFSTTVGRLIHNESEANQIEQLLPGWVGDALLLGKLNLKPPTKIGFAVVPLDPGLPDLTPESTRLMAISMLRMRKIMNYTVGQLQEKGVLTEAASDYAPEEIISLQCQDTVVTALTTLATVRTRIWRQGGDVEMRYRIIKKI